MVKHNGILILPIILAVIFNALTTFVLSAVESDRGFSVIAFITTDSPIYRSNDVLIPEIYVFTKSSKWINARIMLEFYIFNQIYSTEEYTVTIPPTSSSVYYVYNANPFKLDNMPAGVHRVRLLMYIYDRVIEDEVYYRVVDQINDSNLPMILFVWHNHQAPNYLPDGSYHSKWHLIHFFQDDLSPLYVIRDDYGNIVYPDMGSYYLHVYLLKKYPSIKVNLHYSPSLIYQLYNASRNGFTIYDKRVGYDRYIDPSDKLSDLITSFFNDLKKLVNEGRVYVLTSCFAHTIMGYYMDRYDIPDVISYDIELGLNWTRRLIVETDAIWTPEMAWSDKLLPIYLDLGLRITILDGTHHFSNAVGVKGSIYEPYVLTDDIGRDLIVFFRDQYISDAYIGFTNNDWDNPRQVDRDARLFYYAVMDRLRSASTTGRPVVTIALDGENWIIFSNSKAYAAFYLDRLYYYMESLTRRKIMVSGTFRDALESYPSLKKLRSIPSTSWLGGWSKWVSQRGVEQLNMWLKMDEAIAKYKGYAYYNDINGYRKLSSMIKSNKALNKTLNALIHAMDSDYWWAEFFSQTFIDAWLNEFYRHYSSLMRIDITITVEDNVIVKYVDSKIVLRVTNMNDYDMNNTTIFIDRGGEGGFSYTIDIPKMGEFRTEFTVKPRSEEFRVVVKITNPVMMMSSGRYYIVQREFILKPLQPVDLEVYLNNLNYTCSQKYCSIYMYILLTTRNYTIDYNVPVNLTVAIGNETIYKSIVLNRGETTRTVIVNTQIPVGENVRFTIRAITKYDPFIENNVYNGEIVFASTESTPGEHQQIVVNLLKTIAIILYIILTTIIITHFIRRRKTSI